MGIKHKNPIKFGAKTPKDIPLVHFTQNFKFIHPRPTRHVLKSGFIDGT